MPRSRRLFSTLFTAFGLAVLSAAMPAQTQAQTGRIAGTVTDSSRAALAGTQVTVVGTRFNGVSDVSGRYSIVGVPAGTYDLRVQRLGQKAQTVSGVVITA